MILSTFAVLIPRSCYAAFSGMVDGGSSNKHIALSHATERVERPTKGIFAGLRWQLSCITGTAGCALPCHAAASLRQTGRR
ncbi:hypothetical protein B0J12DRAFT_230107 [Macrophomina phaseolina]|uniref:Secreted protein n=1 Tax=Macrophomina phaseolina TaxID=35725 RepID=A0ABQ8GQL5_9PEZI|nr:hypothetical protein B0J12DRAFT_230107 [Macrophomina phaseolina]